MSWIIGSTNVEYAAELLYFEDNDRYLVFEWSIFVSAAIKNIVF